MKLSIIIPAYNEEKNIEKVICLVQNAPVNIEKEIVIVDDGSTDNTSVILNKYKNKQGFKVSRLPKNQGKGAAIRSGLQEVSGDIIVIQDADMEYSINDYPKLIEPFKSPKVNVVFGSRFKGKISGMRLLNKIANKILTLTSNLLYSTHISDEATAYKLFRRQVFKKINLKCERFEFCPEITAKVAKAGYKIYEVPITYNGRSIKEGKKIKLRDAFEAFWTLVKYRFKD